VPRVLVWDGEAAVGQRRCRVTVLTEAAHAFRGVLGAKIHICDPGDPEAKGLVERANGYLATSFLPGRVFSSPADFNASWPTGWCWPTSGSGGRWAARRQTGSRLTAPRCWRCRRWRR
jgi:transposase